MGNCDDTNGGLSVSFDRSSNERFTTVCYDPFTHPSPISRYSQGRTGGDRRVRAEGNEPIQYRKVLNRSK
jgi:hypothetical protein